MNYRAPRRGLQELAQIKCSVRSVRLCSNVRHGCKSCHVGVSTPHICYLCHATLIPLRVVRFLPMLTATSDTIATLAACQIYRLPNLPCQPICRARQASYLCGTCHLCQVSHFRQVCHMRRVSHLCRASGAPAVGAQAAASAPSAVSVTSVACARQLCSVSSFCVANCPP